MRALELLFVVALCLYSLAILAHWKKKKLEPWMSTSLGVGLVADLTGTIVVCLLAEDGWENSPHAVIGLMSLVFMALHYVWADLSLRSPLGKCAKLFSRYSLGAWLLWIVAFVSGIPISALL